MKYGIGQSFEINLSLDKLDEIISQIINNINTFENSEGNTFLQTQGLLRENGNTKTIEEVFKNISQNPTLYPLHEASVDFLGSPHNLMALLKKSIKSTVEPSEASDVFRKFIEKSKKKANIMQFGELVDNLIKQHALLEARIIHNVLHVCHQILAYKDFNKMDCNNIATAFSPTFNEFIHRLGNVTISRPSDLLESVKQATQDNAKFSGMLDRDYTANRFSMMSSKSTGKSESVFKYVQNMILKALDTFFTFLSGIFTKKAGKVKKKKKLIKNHSVDNIEQASIVTYPSCPKSVTFSYQPAKNEEIRPAQEDIKKEENNNRKSKTKKMLNKLKKYF